MAAGDKTQGKRVDNVDDVWTGDPGVYYPVLTDGGVVKALWFKLPTGSEGRIANQGHGNGQEPEWTITIDPDGAVTVSPSIENHEIRSAGGVTVPYWHGYLEGGVWREV